MRRQRTPGTRPHPRRALISRHAHHPRRRACLGGRDDPCRVAGPRDSHVTGMVGREMSQPDEPAPGRGIEAAPQRLDPCSVSSPQRAKATTLPSRSVSSDPAHAAGGHGLHPPPARGPAPHSRSARPAVPSRHAGRGACSPRAALRATGWRHACSGWLLLMCRHAPSLHVHALHREGREDIRREPRYGEPGDRPATGNWLPGRTGGQPARSGQASDDSIHTSRPFSNDAPQARTWHGTNVPTRQESSNHAGSPWLPC